MRHLKRSPGSFAAKSSIAARWRGLCLFAALLLIVGFATALFIPRTEKIELQPVSGAVDFTDPAIPVHTAADGVAVIRPRHMNLPKTDHKEATRDTEALKPVAADPPPASPTAPAADAWAGEPSPTYGGFTLPVPMDAGGSVGLLSIPDLGLSVGVYESDDAMEAMSKGVAHFKHTSNWIGNIGFSAHNINLDGSAGFFRDLYTLKTGAVITYETAQGSRRYTVKSVSEIAETDWSGLARTEDNRLTLITCISGKPEKRLMLTAVEAVS